MKRIILLFLTLLASTALSASLAACASAPSPATAPHETLATATAAPQPTETPTPLPPAVDAKIKEAIGEQEYNELSASIGLNGEIKGVDYATGTTFEGKIKTETIAGKTTADWYFKDIITAQAQDKAGKTFEVVWNPDSNHWVEVTAINTDLMDKEHYTSFNNIDKMVENGDLDLVLLAQGIGVEPFPEMTITPKHWVNVHVSGIILNGKTILDYFLYLSNIPGQGFSIGQEKDFFNQGNKPYKYEAVVNGTTKDGKEIVVLIKNIQNLDKTNILVPIGLDPRLFNFLKEDVLMNDALAIVPVFPLPSEVAPWNNLSTTTTRNGNTYGIIMKGIDYQDDVTVAMQTPGEVFSQLPADIQKGITEKLETEKIKGMFYSFQLTEGISPELAKALSRNIFVPGFHYGPLLWYETPTPSPTP